MNRDEALAKLREITSGIDRDESAPGGWWETSAGSEFGARKLAEMEALIESLV